MRDTLKFLVKMCETLSFKYVGRIRLLIALSRNQWRIRSSVLAVEIQAIDVARPSVDRMIASRSKLLRLCKMLLDQNITSWCGNGDQL